MGCGTTKFETPSGRKNGFELIELRIGHIRDAHEIIGMTPESFTPVVLLPNAAASRCCCVPCCWASVPHGFKALVSRWGKDLHENAEGQHDPDGGWEPGCHWLWPWYRVHHLVSKQLIIYDAPVKGCRSKDAINVNIDVLIVFEVTNPTDFVYKLGPSNLTDLLQASQEEVLRGIARTCAVEDIYDLAGTATDQWVTGMNEKFLPYGVTIHHFTVRAVHIPEQMAKDFEDKTLYESRTVEKQVQLESDTMKMGNEEDLSKLQEECDNAKMAAEEQAVTARAQIAKEAMEVEACTAKEVLVEAAKRDGQVADIVATAELEHETIKAEIMRLSREERATIESEVEKHEANSAAYQIKKEFGGKAKAAEKVALGRVELAKAEGAGTYAFTSRRAQEQELVRLQIIEELAENQQIKVITTLENNTGLAANNSLVSQVVQQGMEMLRVKMAEMTAGSATGLNMGNINTAGVVRATPQQQVMA